MQFYCYLDRQTDAFEIRLVILPLKVHLLIHQFIWHHICFSNMKATETLQKQNYVLTQQQPSR